MELLHVSISRRVLVASAIDAGSLTRQEQEQQAEVSVLVERPVLVVFLELVLISRTRVLVTVVIAADSLTREEPEGPVLVELQ